MMRGTLFNLRQAYSRILNTDISTAIELCSPLLGLDSEQCELYTLAKDFAQKEFRPNANEWDQKPIFPISNYRKASSLGFAGFFVPKVLGGMALNRTNSIIVVEALATGCVATTAMLTIHNACASTINLFGTDEQRATYLPRLCNLDIKASFCLTEPGSGSDAGSLQTRADFDTSTGEYVINGGKAFISGAGMSDLYLVMCREASGGISCLLVPLQSQGLSFGQVEKKMGWNCQPTRQVLFDAVRVPLANRLGPKGHGFKMAMVGLDGGRLNIGACSLGAAQMCFEIAVDYVKERWQFSKAISEQQATQFKLADMAGKISCSRLALRQAAGLLDDGHPAATVHCAMAKKIATDYGFEVCNEALQLMGAHGYLKDYEVERYVRDCRVHQILEGTNEIMRHIVGRAIVAD